MLFVFANNSFSATACSSTHSNLLKSSGTTPKANQLASKRKMRFISVGLILSVLLLAPVLPAKPHGLKVSHHPEFFGDHHTTQATSNGGMKGGKKDGWTLPMTRRLQEDFLWEPYLVYDYLDSSSTGRGLSMTVLWRSSQGCGICLDESSCFVSLQGISKNIELPILFHCTALFK